MTEEERSENRAPGAVPRSMQDVLSQLRGVADQLTGLAGRAEGIPVAGMAALRSLPGMPGLPLSPGALSAAQLKVIADSVSAQRRSIEALKAQLTAFDDQLAVLERILGPLTEWSTTWAELERRLTQLGRRPEQ